MKIRIKKSVRGSLHYGDWVRVYVLQIKAFIFWHEVGVYDSIDEAKEHLDKFGNPSELIFKY